MATTKLPKQLTQTIINKMRNFFAQHPIFASLLGGCFLILVFSSVFLLAFVGVVAKVVNKGIDVAKIEGTKNGQNSYTYVAGNKNSTNKFLQIPITGIILTSADTQSYAALYSGVTYGYSIKKQLIDATADENIKGIILDIDSPGGTITGSKAIYDGIKYFQSKTNKPVIAHISGMAASGGYMAALPANKIIADYGTLAGSIGVIFGPFKYYDGVVSEGSILNNVTTTNGIETFYITAGTDKDLGNPNKKMSDKATQTLQTNVDLEYKNFVDMVSTNRAIPQEKIINELGALIYSNDLALQNKLIDNIGDKQSTYAEIASEANISSDDFKVVTLEQESILNMLFNLSNKQESALANTCILCNQMLYLYGTPREYLIR